MASTPRAPKQWVLQKNETVNSFESWKQNLLFTLKLEPSFAPFLAEGAVWEPDSEDKACRGFVTDADPIPEGSRLTAEQKLDNLELMLGQIANYVGVISRNSIMRCTSISEIWQKIRLHFGFQSTGAHFLHFSEFKLEHNERPEDLYQRMLAFLEDNLLRSDGNITHHGKSPSKNEIMSPSLENLLVLTWLQLLHKDLPKLVKQIPIWRSSLCWASRHQPPS